MNPFSQRIGIWYTDEEWINNIYDELIKIISPENIVKCMKNHEKTIYLKDGTLIRMVSVKTSSRGSCFSKSYIQDTISKAEYDRIVKKCTKPIFYDSIVIRNIDDLIMGKNIANRRYWQEKETTEEKVDRKNNIINAIKTKCDAYPELRFCQLLVCVFGKDPFYLTDEEALKKISEFGIGEI